MIVARARIHGHVIQAADFEGLIAPYALEVGVSHEEAKRLLATTWWQTDDPNVTSLKPRTRRRRTMADLLSGAVAILRDAVGDTVAPIEAERRARVCVACPMKSETIDCTSCGAYATVKAALARQFNRPVLPVEGVATLGCGVCDCACAVMVWAQPSAFSKASRQLPERPDNCWVKHL